MFREKFDHGFDDKDWEAAKAEARDAMIDVAARKGVIAYSDLVSKIRTVSLDPHGSQLAHMLGEISTSEYYAARGMLTVVVVHKGGDSRPGKGFFELADSLGLNTTDQEALWVRELEKVHRAWGQSNRRMSRGLLSLEECGSSST